MHSKYYDISDLHEGCAYDAITDQATRTLMFVIVPDFKTRFPVSRDTVLGEFNGQ